MQASVRKPRPGPVQTSPGRADQNDRNDRGSTQTDDHDQHIHEVHGVPLSSTGGTSTPIRRAFSTDLPRAQRIIQEFRRAGHKVCLDDFGAGAASFPYLRAFTIDFVKIDGAYVSRMLDAMRDHAILKAMVQLCSDLGTVTIAEMIETDAQAQRLAQTGVDYGQGYLFGRPTPTPAMPGILARKVPPRPTRVA